MEKKLIDANELLEKHCAYVAIRNGIWFHGVTAADIENAPAVDAEPVRHAHWKLKIRFPGGIEWRKCSLCGREVNGDDRTDYAKKFPYCHCGAKMDGEEENEEG